MAGIIRKRWVLVLSAEIICIAVIVSSVLAYRAYYTPSPITSVDELYGTYIATYSFGTDKLVLKHDGTFSQYVIVPSEPPPATSTGTWVYSHEQGVSLMGGYLIIDNGMGSLRTDWRIPTKSKPTSIDVMRVSTHILMNTEAAQSYAKQVEN